mmetsp:Transcript_35243/g.87504  ORF Transcript_35243/g.87504 Transcript_35243/m.87504 type:complete len:222 (+) Transcript_35243:1530-2195(+)
MVSSSRPPTAPTTDSMPPQMSSTAAVASNSRGTAKSMTIHSIEGKLFDRQPSNAPSVRLTEERPPIAKRTVLTCLSSPRPSNTPLLSSGLTLLVKLTLTFLRIFCVSSRPAAPPTGLRMCSSVSVGNGCRYSMMAGRGEGVSAGRTKPGALRTHTCWSSNAVCALSNLSVLAMSMAAWLGLSTGWVRSCSLMTYFTLFVCRASCCIIVLKRGEGLGGKSSL